MEQSVAFKICRKDLSGRSGNWRNPNGAYNNDGLKKAKKTSSSRYSVRNFTGRLYQKHIYNILSILLDV